MTTLKLLRRNLFHFRAANLAAIVGMAVATAVLTGALMVGDSVRASLRDLAVRRLGKVDDALMASRFFNEDLAGRISADKDFHQQYQQCVPGVILRGGAVRDDSSSNAKDRPATAGVQIAALGDWIPVSAGKSLINATVAGNLADSHGPAGAGASLLLNLPAISDAPRDATMARRERSETTAVLHATVLGLTTDNMATLFNLAGGQRTPQNVWTHLPDLQSAIGQAKKANVLLVSAAYPGADNLNKILRRVVSLDDYGLSVARSKTSDDASLTSQSTYIAPAVDEAAAEVSKDLNIHLQRVLIYMVNTAIVVPDGATTRPASRPVIDTTQPSTGPRLRKPRHSSTEHETHYAVAAGISDIDGKALGDDEIAINQYTADQIGAKVGARIRLDYYKREPNGVLVEVRSDSPAIGLIFRVARILPMTGVGADASLTPTFKGLTDADSIANWDPPAGLTIDKNLVSDEDEQYWNKYHAAPKFFVNYTTAKRLWGQAFGELTSIRIPADRAEEFQTELRNRIDPAKMGLVFRDVKNEQLAAASGGTDFSEYFIYFSFFIIVAAALLLGMLLRLGIEQRARQFGTLTAIGFAPKTLRRLTVIEGMFLALIGGLVGLGGAVGYTAFIVHGLRTWWRDAIGTTEMQLAVIPMTLVTGLVISLVLALLTIFWSLRRVRKTSVIALMGGRVDAGSARPAKSRPFLSRLGLIVGVLSFVGALAMLGAAASGKMKAQEAFLGGGFLMLIAVLIFLRGRLKPRLSADRPQLGASGFPIAALAMRNASRHGTRSMLTIALIAVATFTLITVAAMRQGAPRDWADKTSGAGGFAFVLQADIPLEGDLNTVVGRDIVGLTNAKDPLWKNVNFISMRIWAGQDISCLNITKPTQPTILAVPHSLVERKAFSFARTEEKAENPWSMLEKPIDHDEVPVVADDETAEYILKLELGKTMPLVDQAGRTRKLKLVGTLKGSIFQSQMLMGEANFQQLFPNQSGYSMVLADAPAALADQLRLSLPRELDEYSVAAETTAARLQMFNQIADTYLSTFQALGALGLMLGTIGLAVVLIRSLIERRSELAILAALGFGTGARLRLVLAENVWLLLLGLAAGIVCALVAIVPALWVGARGVNPAALVGMVGMILVTGMVALIAATLMGARKLSPAALRME